MAFIDARLAVAEHRDQVGHACALGQRDGGFQFLQQHGVMGRVVETHGEEIVALGGVAHGDRQTTVVDHRPFVRVDQIDAGKTDSLEPPAQFRQRRLRGPAAQRLLQAPWRHLLRPGWVRPAVGRCGQPWRGAQRGDGGAEPGQRIATGDAAGGHDASIPSTRRLNAASAPVAAKSSNARSVTLMMCSRMNVAPSAAPCSASLMQHSHSSTAQPG